ncbi:MAG: UPF0149 family protein [Gammaproteobacteria bacterium]
MSAAIYERVEQTLAALDCDLGPAECHGTLCGMLSGPGAFDLGGWLRHLAGGDDVSAWRDGEAEATMAALVRHTVGELEDQEFGFSLLLPDDDARLPERAAAFSAWCRGYLSGLGLSGIEDLAALGEHAQEFVEDVRRFGAIGVEGEGSEEDERAFAELCEFTRMGVLVLRADARADKSAKPASPSLH